ncbi:MAG: DUF2442 domain-containing protein [Planctomycetes bacterium]|nr:DUF2442 domain-containing protein [Planctomycetota bacterium]
MSTSAPEPDPRAVGVRVDGGYLTVDLADGRRISVPMSWFPKLLAASPGARGNCEIFGDGQGIHWPDIDEDLSVAGLLRGATAPRKSRGAV